MTDQRSLVALERVARDELARTAEDSARWAAKRRKYLRELHAQLGTWKKVAEATGQNEPAVYQAVYQPRKKTP